MYDQATQVMVVPEDTSSAHNLAVMTASDIFAPAEIRNRSRAATMESKRQSLMRSLAVKRANRHFALFRERSYLQSAVDPVSILFEELQEEIAEERRCVIEFSFLPSISQTPNLIFSILQSHHSQTLSIDIGAGRF